MRYQQNHNSTCSYKFSMDKAGTVKVLDGDNNIIFQSDLIYLDSVEELGFFQRLIAIIWNWIKSLFN